MRKFQALSCEEICTTPYRPIHFHISELVPLHVYKQFGDTAFEFLDPRALYSLDQLREKFGPTIVNTYNSRSLQKAVGGQVWEWRGLRTSGCHVGAALSQHRFGRAFDCTFLEHTPEEVRKYLKSHTDEFLLINAIEGQVNWLHFDVRNRGRLFVFNP